MEKIASDLTTYILHKLALIVEFNVSDLNILCLLHNLIIGSLISVMRQNARIG